VFGVVLDVERRRFELHFRLEKFRCVFRRLWSRIFFFFFFFVWSSLSRELGNEN
jgi:hypothetical protein